MRLSSVPRGRPSMTAPRLLSGLVACGMCHSAMYAKRGARAGELAYVCSKCGRISIQLDGTDAEVTDRVLTFLSNTELRPIGEQDPASLPGSARRRRGRTRGADTGSLRRAPAY